MATIVVKQNQRRTNKTATSATDALQRKIEKKGGVKEKIGERSGPWNCIYLTQSYPK